MQRGQLHGERHRRALLVRVDPARVRDDLKPRVAVKAAGAPSGAAHRPLRRPLDRHGHDAIEHARGRRNRQRRRRQIRVRILDAIDRSRRRARRQRRHRLGRRRQPLGRQFKRERL